MGLWEVPEVQARAVVTRRASKVVWAGKKMVLTEKARRNSTIRSQKRLKRGTKSQALGIHDPLWLPMEGQVTKFKLLNLPTA